MTEREKHLEDCLVEQSNKTKALEFEARLIDMLRRKNASLTWVGRHAMMRKIEVLLS
jgi:hypothetical protein